MKEIKVEIRTIEVKARVRKLNVNKNYPRPFNPDTDEIKIINVTGKTDEELHNDMMKNNQNYRAAFEYYIREEREKKLKRILNNGILGKTS